MIIASTLNKPSLSLSLFQDLVRSLTSNVKDESIRQRLRRGAMEMLSSLFRKDEPISEEVTKMALELLLHPDIDVSHVFR